jgi:hypothetical protein
MLRFVSKGYQTTVRNPCKFAVFFFAWVRLAFGA